MTAILYFIFDPRVTITCPVIILTVLPIDLSQQKKEINISKTQCQYMLTYYNTDTIVSNIDMGYELKDLLMYVVCCIYIIYAWTSKCHCCYLMELGRLNKQRVISIGNKVT